jgi:beta-glucanase (GH16 family)
MFRGQLYRRSKSCLSEKVAIAMAQFLPIALLMPLAFGAAAASPAAEATASKSMQPYKQVWADEFDGPAGGRPDARKWVFDLGYGNNLWGNHEHQTYTDDPDNIHLDGQGHLVINARKMPDGKYTSARIKTLGRFEQKFGKFEARIRIPRGPGLLPAFWMMGKRGNWPDNGEIDIVENVGTEPRILHSNVHGPGYDGQGQYVSSSDLADDFHVYGIEWSAGSITWFRRHSVQDRHGKGCSRWKALDIRRSALLPAPQRRHRRRLAGATGRRGAAATDDRRLGEGFEEIAGRACSSLDDRH